MQIDKLVYELYGLTEEKIRIVEGENVGAGLKPALLLNVTDRSKNRGNKCRERYRAGFKPAPTIKHHGLPEIIRAFKTFSSRQINKIKNTPGNSLWQRNYYEHIIRNEDDLNKIREYIMQNPMRWDEDEENPYRPPSSDRCD